MMFALLAKQVRCWDYVTKRELFRSSWGPKFKQVKSSKALKKKKPKAALPEAPVSESADSEGAAAAAAATSDKATAGVEGSEDGNALASPEPSSSSSAAALEAEYMMDLSPEPSTAEANALPPPPAAVTALKWAPVTVAPDGRSIFVGFSDGVVRVLWRGDATAPKNSAGSTGSGSGNGGSLSTGSNSKYAGKWVREQVFKPHNGAVSAVAFSADGYFLATAGKDGKVFLLADFDATASNGKRHSAKSEGTRQFSPLGFVAVTRDDPESPETPSPSGDEQRAAFATSLCFRSDGLALLLSASNGSVCEVSLTTLRSGKSNDLQLTAGNESSNGSGEGDNDEDGNGAAATGGADNNKTDSFALALPKAWHTMKRPKADKVAGGGAGGGGSGESTDGAAAAAEGSSGGGDGNAGGEGSVVATSEVEDGEEEATELPLPPALQCTYVRNRSGSSVPGQPTAPRLVLHMLLFLFPFFFFLR